MKYNLLFSILLFILIGGCKDPNPSQTDIDLSNITYEPQSYPLEIGNPLFPFLEQPQDNLLTVDGVDLGRHLFYDPILSDDLSMSCSSCHLPSGSFTDNLALSTGIDGIQGKRSSMSLLNIGFNYRGLFWDGRVATLEEQALLPVEDPIELHALWPEVILRLQDSELYREKFRKAFGISNSSEITKELAAKAMAQFERTLISATGSKFDRSLLGLDAFSPEELLGYEMFFDYYQGTNPEIPDAQCFHCHDQPLFTSNDFENNGLDFANDFEDFADLGFGGTSGIKGDNGKFRIPTLRNIEYTAPYMHDGRFETLEEVIEHYASGGHYSPTKSPFLDSIDLNEQQKLALKAFLLTLSDEDFMQNPEFSDPF